MTDIQDKDSPTHRIHMQQMSMDEIRKFVEQLRIRRASQAEKIKKAKANTKIAEAMAADKSFKRLIDKMEKSLKNIESDLDQTADDLNKARALFLQMSDGEVFLEKEIKSDGNA